MHVLLLTLHDIERENEGALTREKVPVAVGFILGLLTVGDGRHLLGRGAAHLLLLSCSPPHSWALQAHLERFDSWLTIYF